MTNLTKTIEPAIQESILEALPKDGQLALNLMAQLSANMILSIPNTTIDGFTLLVENYFYAYRGS